MNLPPDLFSIVGRMLEWGEGGFLLPHSLLVVFGSTVSALLALRIVQKAVEYLDVILTVISVCLAVILFVRIAMAG